MSSSEQSFVIGLFKSTSAPSTRATTHFLASDCDKSRASSIINFPDSTSLTEPSLRVTLTIKTSK